LLEGPRRRFTLWVWWFGFLCRSFSAHAEFNLETWRQHACLGQEIRLRQDCAPKWRQSCRKLTNIERVVSSLTHLLHRRDSPSSPLAKTTSLINPSNPPQSKNSMPLPKRPTAPLSHSSTAEASFPITLGSCRIDGGWSPWLENRSSAR
jgi:hypothetical protein